MSEAKPLTVEDRLRFAFGHICLGISVQTLAALFGVNMGRVSEAIDAITKAAQDPNLVRELWAESQAGTSTKEGA